MIDKVARQLTFMDKSHEPSEGYSSSTVKSWMVEYTVTVDDEENRHLSLILADDMGDIHEHLLTELRKMYKSSKKVDVTVHRIEPVSTNTDSLFFEGMYSP